MSADSPLAALPRVVLAADLAAHPIALNTASGTTPMERWPASARPTATLEVGNTGAWLMAIAAGRAVGISTTATPSNRTHPSLLFRPLVDAPPVPPRPRLARRPRAPGRPDLPALTREVPAGGAAGRRVGA